MNPLTASQLAQLIIFVGFDAAVKIADMIHAGDKPVTQGDVIELRGLVKPYSAYDPTLPAK